MSEQELREKLEEVIGYLCCDFTPENANEYSYNQKCKWCGRIRANRAHRLKDELTQLITQYATQCRIDELEAALSEVIDWSIDDSDSAIQGYGEFRIAQLKKELEDEKLN